jgi:superfamily II DNA or RNA helicase
MPLHPKAREFFKSGIYTGLASFEELEHRITAIGENKSKGDAFEVFAEAYLATQRKHDADKVWPLSVTPLGTLKKLGLAEQDYGVDGVFLTLLGHHNAYQVKFRTTRSPLTWRELSTFMGLADSPHIRSRILITNCDELPAVLNERQGFFCIRGSDLDRLQPEDFQAMESWLADADFEVPKKCPQEHQAEALGELVPALEVEDRISAIMACGTGKTLVALWVAEQLQSSLVLVLLPSLALLRQTLHEWLRETNLPALAYLCVCSDPTVTDGADAFTTLQSDLDFEVSTNPDNVRQFLDAVFTGTKVIFSTYQSAAVIGKAMKPGECFDLGIFDEAHKTAGREGRNYGFALDDSNLPIRKRLFVTATPRHYNPHQRDREGEAQMVFSMDNPQVYGRQAFCLTFGEAARRNIICNYKVIISVITSEMVTNDLLSRGEVIINGDAIRARQVANQIALRDAVEKYGVSKIFTFHKTVKSAASFVAAGNEGVCTHLPTFGAFHVNGEMPTARRERVMREFRGASCAVMSNARCLTEGVDVPAVDMVAFLSPRRSRVDIVQAAGRAMRRAPGKALGYVLVPLYVELATGESVDDAVGRADFDEVWDVLQSLQEQDEALAELIRHVGEQKGRGKGFDDRGFGDKIDFGGPRLTLESLRAAVTTRCLENLYVTWDVWFGKLKSFKDRFGHCKIPQNWEEPGLASWMSRQRLQKDNLASDQLRRLDEIGFVWDLTGLAWDEMFAKLTEFKMRFGHCNVETKWEEDPSLSGWVSAQRTRKSRDVLNDDKILRLEELGFIWDYQKVKASATWLKWYRDLEGYTRLHGNSDVPRTHSNKRLSSWVSNQRQRRRGTLQKKGKEPDLITSEQIILLDKLGFHWDAHEDKWTEGFEALQAFKAAHGHCDVVEDPSINKKLLNWIRTQRVQLSKGTITPERKLLLDEIGFNRDSKTDQRWSESYERLVIYHAEHGDADVPSKWKENRKLASWVSVQRQRRKQNQIADEEIRLLDLLGFTWKSRDVGTWEDRLEEIKEFKITNGHCDVPLNYPANPKLGRFVNSMRTQKSRGVLSEHRIKLLEQTGFRWNAQITQDEEAWKKRCKQLQDYKDRFGNCNDPNQWKEDPQLGRWALYQRQMKRSGRIHPKLEEMLNTLGFDWGFKINLDARRLHDSWAIRYDQLLEFRSLNNHCNVPARWPENPELGGWVIRQRRLKKSNQILPEREKKLIDVGFTWQLVDRSEDPSGSERISSLESTSERLAASWKRMFDELVCYRGAHGNFDVPVKWEANPQLGMWTAAQRSLGKSGRLRPDRKQMLDEIEFDWRTESRKEEWGTRLEQLKAYKERFGDCGVPVRWPENKQMGMWVAAQRTMRKSGKLQQDREMLLSEIGFDWRADSHNEEWASRLEQLKAYRERFGNCRVPVKWDENPRLGAWVTNQRHRLKSGALTPDKAQLLDELGL